MEKDQKKIGVVLSYLAQGVGILSSILYTPVMLRLLGQSEYGLYQLVASVVSYLGILSFGFYNTYMRFYFRYKKDREKLAKLNGLFMMLFIIIALVSMALGLLMVANIELIFKDGLTQSEYKLAGILMLILIVNIGITFPNIIFDAFTAARERFVFQKTILLLNNILNPFIALPLLIMGYGSVAVVVVTTFLSLLKLISNIYYCKKKLGVEFIYRNVNFSLLREMWNFTFFIFLGILVNQVNWSLDKFLLGRYLGTISVAIYGIGAQLNNIFRQLSASFTNIFISSVNRIVVEEENDEKISRVYAKLGRIQFIISFFILSGYLILGRPFIEIWAGPDYRQSYYVGILLLGSAAIPLVQSIGVEIQRAKNLHRVSAFMSLIVAVLNIIISIPLIRLYGPVGAALGTAITMFFGDVLFTNWYFYKRVNLDIVQFWKEIGKLLPALILSFLISFVLFIKIFEINSLIRFALAGALFAIIYFLAFWFMAFNDYEKGMFTGGLQKIKGKFRRNK